ncbi:hypothetical protein PR048_026358 [Dryococelus australis]|uniref:Cytochrome P450 n=1 Tax=Dryococelus australis TaxID=614101 RepID=A0ABQ9GL42_9NEOP|nr:hypothetical protein PR048_026358 [Dryococelus australis]
MHILTATNITGAWTVAHFAASLVCSGRCCIYGDSRRKSPLRIPRQYLTGLSLPELDVGACVWQHESRRRGLTRCGDLLLSLARRGRLLPTHRVCAESLIEVHYRRQDCAPVQCFARRGDERVDAHVSVTPSPPTFLSLRRAKFLRPGGHLNRPRMNTYVLVGSSSTGEGETRGRRSSGRMQERVERDYPEKTCSRPLRFPRVTHRLKMRIGVDQCWVHAQKTNKRSTSSLVCGVTPPRIKPGSPRRETSSLAAKLPRPCYLKRNTRHYRLFTDAMEVTAVMWGIVAVLLSCVYVARFWLQRAKLHCQLNKLPGPPAYPIIGTTYQFFGTPRHSEYCDSTAGLGGQEICVRNRSSEHNVHASAPDSQARCIHADNVRAALLRHRKCVHPSAPDSQARCIHADNVRAALLWHRKCVHPSAPDSQARCMHADNVRAALLRHRKCVPHRRRSLCPHMCTGPQTSTCIAAVSSLRQTAARSAIAVTMLLVSCSKNVTLETFSAGPCQEKFQAPEQCAILNGTKHLDKPHTYRFLVPLLGSGLVTSRAMRQTSSQHFDEKWRALMDLMQPMVFPVCLIAGNEPWTTSETSLKDVKTAHIISILARQKWHTHRKIITPAFHLSILESFIEVFSEKCEILMYKLDQKADGSGFDIYPYITRCAMDIICGNFFAPSEKKHSGCSGDRVFTACCMLLPIRTEPETAQILHQCDNRLALDPDTGVSLRTRHYLGFNPLRSLYTQAVAVLGSALSCSNSSISPLDCIVRAPQYTIHIAVLFRRCDSLWPRHLFFNSATSLLIDLRVDMVCYCAPQYTIHIAVHFRSNYAFLTQANTDSLHLNLETGGCICLVRITTRDTPKAVSSSLPDVPTSRRGRSLQRSQPLSWKSPRPSLRAGLYQSLVSH